MNVNGKWCFLFVNLPGFSRHNKKPRWYIFFIPGVFD